jgi:hypothetical protein
MAKLMPVLGLLFVLLLTSCATSRTAGWDQETTSMTLDKAQKDKLYKKALKHWKMRHHKEELEKSLAAWEMLNQAEPANYEYLTYLTRGYYFLADAHYDKMKTKKKYWEVGTSWGEKALATNNKFKKLIAQGTAPEDAVHTLTKKEIEALYWSAANLGKWAKNSGIATTLKYKSRIRNFIKRVEQLDEKYFYGAAHRYWGAYYAVAPAFAGGDMKKSLKSFKKALRISPKYLGTYVLYAQMYDTKKGDKAGFKKRLNKVINTSDDIDKSILPENIVEKRKAEKLLANMDELF